MRETNFNSHVSACLPVRTGSGDDSYEQTMSLHLLANVQFVQQLRMKKVCETMVEYQRYHTTFSHLTSRYKEAQTQAFHRNLDLTNP